MEKNIIIIDDFYDDPDIVRKYALSLDYPDPQAGYTYPGRNSKLPLWNKALTDRLSECIGEQIIGAEKSANGFFRKSPHNANFKQDIHVDPGYDWAGVLYLDPNPHWERLDGTCFWRHKYYGFEKAPRTPQEAEKYGFKTFDEIRKKVIYGDGLDRSKWDNYLKVPFKYNRIVLFRPWLWHSHGDNFGTTIEDCRLVQLFFMHSVNNPFVEDDPVINNKDKSWQDQSLDIAKKFEKFRDTPQESKQSVLLPPNIKGPIKSPKYFFEK